MIDYTKLSKEISYALRHAPWEYELELDPDGYVPIEQLLAAINEDSSYDRMITVDDLKYIIDNSEKKRHEIQGGMIRALYGHTVPVHISKDPTVPPDTLYHGTTHRALSNIMEEGLKPMKRQYVHLSADIDTAVSVGRRRDPEPVILTIDAGRAYRDGIKFYTGNDKVILADYILSKYILVMK